MRAARAKYAYNGRALRQLIGDLQPHVVIYGDGSCYFPAVGGSHLSVWDLQDAVNLSELSPEMQVVWRDRFLSDLPQVDLRYAVSQQAAEGLERQIGRAFGIRELPNGADFEEIQCVSDRQIAQLRDRHGLHGKKVATYIGGDVWFDPIFAVRLMRHLLSRGSHWHLVVVGNTARFDLENVSFVGPVAPEVAAAYYNLSDAGLLLKDSRNNPFLYESVPLKIVQYAAARKPIVTFPVQWCESEQFENVSIHQVADVQNWGDSLLRLETDFTWTERMETKWSAYSWHAIATTVYAQICHALGGDFHGEAPHPSKRRPI